MRSFPQILSVAALTLATCTPKAPPRAVGTASLSTGTFTTFLVEATCAADDTPESCDPPTAYPVDLHTRTALVGTFVPSAAMCGAFELSVKLDNAVAWEGKVSGGGEQNAIGTFIIGEAEPGLHLLSVSAKAADPCYQGKLGGWYGTFTLAAADPPRIGSAATATDSHALGREVFVTCEPCHGPAAAGRQALNAPAIAAQEPWYLERQIENFKAGRRGTHDRDLYGMQMRPMALELQTPERVRAVVDYISSLPHPRQELTVQGDTKKGAELFLVCAVCHGEDGRGDATVGAPRLTVQQDWYLVRQIRNFKEGLRGYHADDRYGQEMKPMTGTLPDEAAIRDVVAYVQTLRDLALRETVVASAAPVPVAAAPAPAPAPMPAPAPVPVAAAPAPAPAPAPVPVAAAPAPAKPAPAPAPAKPAPAPAPAGEAAPAGPDKAALMKRGGEVYGKICAPCHQATGQGIPGAFPPLAGSGEFYGSPKKQAGIIINGLSGEITVQGKTYNGAMPPQGSLSNEDIAAVATYVRNSWGNNDGIVTPADVASAR